MILSVFAMLQGDVSFKVDRKKAGMIGTISDLEKDGIEIYDQFKSRKDIELAFDVMKNDLLSDKIYLRDTISLRGYFFITILALRVHFKKYFYNIREEISLPQNATFNW